MIRIGVLTDMSGPYADITGAGSVLGARMAIEDHHAVDPSLRVELVQADMQDKPDVALGIAGKWLDREGVDLILDVPLSSAAFGIATMVKDRDKAAIFTGPSSSDLTGKACGPNHLHWVFDTWSVPAATASALVSEGGNAWFFIVADYAFGHALERDTALHVAAAGGKVLGQALTPFPDTTDFAAFLVQARASGANVLALANAGSDTANCLKQAAEFGLSRGGVRIALLIVQIGTIHAIGLATAQGALLCEAFYWDLNDATRGFSRRFAARLDGRMPSAVQAGTYSATLHYLKAVSALGAAKAKSSGRLVLDEMKAMPTDDPVFGKGSVRLDGRKIHDLYLFQVKTPAESHQPWDYYKLIRTIPAEAAFRPLKDGGCPLVQG